MEELLDRLTSIKAMLEELQMLLPNFDKTVIYHGRNNCVNDCFHWDDKNACCGLFKAVPPPHIIVKPELCDKFEIDIPF